MRQHYRLKLLSVMVLTVVAVSAISAPDAYVKKLNHDSGTLRGEDRLEHTLYIENRGTEELAISRIDGCGGPCKSYVLERDRIQPSDKAWVKFSFDLYLANGLTIKRRQIHSNDPDEPSIPLEFRANVLKDYKRAPEMLFFEVADSGKSEAQSMLIVSIEKPVGDLTRAECDSELFSGAIEKMKSPGTYRLTVRTAESMPDGLSRAEFVLSGEDEAVPKCTIRVSAYHKPRFALLPERLVYLPIDKDQLRIIFVRQAVKNPVSLVNVSTEIDSVSCEVHPGPGSGDYRIYVRARQLAGKGGSLGRITLGFDDGGSHEIPVLVRGVILQEDSQ